jgi:uncharacterized surface protein with fasciclin (FAS1) repeats
MKKIPLVTRKHRSWGVPFRVGGRQGFSWLWCLVLFTLFFFGLIACTKTKTATVNNPTTPLQNLVNSDTSLTLFHHLLLRGNDVALLADDSVTILIPTNAALRQAGYPESIVDSSSSALVDRMLRYQYLPSGLVADSGTLTANPTLLGPPIYAQRQNDGTILFNTYAATTSGTPQQVGKAKVYFLNAALSSPLDSLPELLQNDTSLTFLAEAFTRTNFYDSALLSGSYTLMVPSNDAFRKAGYDSVGAIDSADYNTIVQLLGNQVIKGAYFSPSFPASVQRMQGSDVTVTYNGGLPQFTTPANPVPVNLLYANQVAGKNLIPHWTDGILSP